MKTTTINSAQALYDAQTPPDDAEYEKKMEEFLWLKNKSTKAIENNKMYLMISFLNFNRAVHSGDVNQELIDKYGDFMRDAVEWAANRFAIEETGFKP